MTGTLTYVSTYWEGGGQEEEKPYHWQKDEGRAENCVSNPPKEWIQCPYCVSEVKNVNLEKHIKKVHPSNKASTAT